MGLQADPADERTTLLQNPAASQRRGTQSKPILVYGYSILRSCSYVIVVIFDCLFGRSCFCLSV
jgi:hypothetical protein